MIYRLLADAVVLIHLAFIIFVLFGGFLVLKWRRVAWFHIPAFVWGVLLEFAGWWCPLTPLENWLRRTGGSAGYPTGFIEHYILPVIYPSALTRDIQFVLGTVVLIVNVVIYSIAVRRLVGGRT
ncbi:MAG: DUF2784 domain-containing protein [Candidatus Latescibacterota bacterium]|nr:MAG: DUF2784 domain-containing protein [Candidatus Latescibacterota bacterium]